MIAAIKLTNKNKAICKIKDEEDGNKGNTSSTY